MFPSCETKHARNLHTISIATVDGLGLYCNITGIVFTGTKKIKNGFCEVNRFFSVNAQPLRYLKHHKREHVYVEFSLNMQLKNILFSRLSPLVRKLHICPQDFQTPFWLEVSH